MTALVDINCVIVRTLMFLLLKVANDGVYIIFFCVFSSPSLLVYYHTFVFQSISNFLKPVLPIRSFKYLFLRNMDYLFIITYLRSVSYT